MGMGRSFALTLFCSLLAGPTWADFAADEFPPYERCALCHGLFGVSHTDKFPNLGGQKSSYIAAQIAAFLAGERTNDGGQMAAIVTELKPDEIPVAVDWFASQDPPEPAGEGSAEGAALFATLDCASCHDNQPGASIVPFLTAQHAGYLLKQMGDFRDGRRGAGSDIGALHQTAFDLSDAELATIAAYLAAEGRP